MIANQILNLFDSNASAKVEIRFLWIKTIAIKQASKRKAYDNVFVKIDLGLLEIQSHMLERQGKSRKSHLAQELITSRS